MATKKDGASGPAGMKIGLESNGRLPAKVVADFLAAHDRAYRKYCSERGVKTRLLVVEDSGTASWWAVLTEVYSVGEIASQHNDVLAAFMTEFSAVVSKAKAGTPTEAKEAFVTLLKQYKKAIKHKSVKAVFIGSVVAKQVDFRSEGELDIVLRYAVPISQKTAAVGRAPIYRVEGPAAGRPALPSQLSKSGTALIVGTTPYVRLEGMEGTLLPAKGIGASALQHDQSYTFYGHKLFNEDQEPIGYEIASAFPTDSGRSLVTYAGD